MPKVAKASDLTSRDHYTPLVTFHRDVAKAASGAAWRQSDITRGIGTFQLYEPLYACIGWRYFVDKWTKYKSQATSLAKLLLRTK